MGDKQTVRVDSVVQALRREANEAEAGKSAWSGCEVELERYVQGVRTAIAIVRRVAESSRSDG